MTIKQEPITDEDIKWLMDNPLEAKYVLLGDFCRFLRVFHFYMTRSQFDLQPFHYEIGRKLVSYMKGTNEKQNLYIGISPRAGKSQIVIDFIAYAYAANPFSNFIYTSYSNDLCVKHSKKIRDIVESPLFQTVFGLCIDQNTAAANLWKIAGGGEFRSVPMAGSITGFGCFGKNIPVKTDKGYFKLGDIVKKKMPVKVYSWGEKGIELVPILNYVESDLSVDLSIVCGKEKITATKNHLFMTKDGWKRADELVVGDWIFVPNSLNHIFRTIKGLGNGFYRMFSIDNIRNLFRGEKFFINWDIVPASLKSDSDSFFCPLKTAFNVGNLTAGKRKVFCDKFVRSSVDSDFTGNFWSNLGVSVMSAVFNAILFIVRLCPISKIRNRIISSDAIKMSNHKSIRFAKKSQSDQFMNSGVFSSTKSDTKIASVVNPRFKNFICFLGKYLPRLSNIVVRMMGYRVISDVIKCNHSKKSYCLSTKNHNFLIGKSQVCVHNCGTFDDRFGGAILVDDFMKADNYKSKVEKQNAIDIFENTLRSRKNRPSKDPTIIIAQRLSKDDLIDYIKEKYPDEWDFFVIPALNEQTGESFWEERYPAKMLLEMKEQNPYLFYSQYQQEPITLGGGVFKHSWWVYYKDTNVPFRRIYITADTAMKTNEWNDFTAIGVWGLTNDNKLYLLDMVHGKFEAPELESAFISLWNKWKNGIGNRHVSAVYIEDKASGTGLIQSLRRKGGLPIVAITPEKDKLSRAMDCVGYVASGCVYLPESENHPISREFLAELDAFSADGSAAHDDICDMTNYAISQAFEKRGLF